MDGDKILRKIFKVAYGLEKIRQHCLNTIQCYYFKADYYFCIISRPIHAALDRQPLILFTVVNAPRRHAT